MEATIYGDGPGSVRERIRQVVAEAGSQKAAAERLGISAAYLSDILLKRRAISAEVGAKVGYERVVVWVRTGSSA